MTGERGMEVLKYNPYIKKLILHVKDSVPIDKLGEKIKKSAKENQCDRTIDLNESVEVALSLHPRSPEYSLPKYERRSKFERNFYEFCFEFCGEDWKGVDLNPELFFDDKELKQAHSYLNPDSFNLLVGMSGSGTNKTYEWTQEVCGSIKEKYGSKVHIITVGDVPAKIIEPEGEGITNLAGEVSMRISMALTGIVDCVISPDTGLLHASGCYNTPKIGLLGHVTKEVITKHFFNDYSVEADENLSECAPCLRLIYNPRLQCPTHVSTGGVLCMSAGIPPETVFNKFEEVYSQYLSSKTLP